MTPFFFLQGVQSIVEAKTYEWSLDGHDRVANLWPFVQLETQTVSHHLYPRIWSKGLGMPKAE